MTHQGGWFLRRWPWCTVLARGVFARTVGPMVGYCTHALCHVDAGRYDCPDCGQVVVTRWVRYVCQSCQAPRAMSTVFNHPVADTPCCVECGSVHVASRIVVNPTYFSIQRGAILQSKKLVDDKPRWVACFKKLCAVTLEASVKPVSRTLD